MQIPPQKLREVAFLIVYAENTMGKDVHQAEDLIMQELKITRKTFRTTLERLSPLFTKKAEFDELLGKTSTSFSLERIGAVELTILRLSLYEHLQEGLAKAIVIHEAVRLARKFSSPEAGDFIHAVLEDALNPSNVSSHPQSPIITEDSAADDTTASEN